MGMDLVPRNPIKGFHANWSGWSTLQVLLHFLDQDITHMDGANNGHRVSAKDAKKWAKAVREAVEKKSLMIVNTYDPTYEDDTKDWIIPTAKKEEFEAIAKRVQKSKKIRLATSPLEVYLAMVFATRRKLPHRNAVQGYEKFKKADADWLLRFADFCEKSSGFSQC